MERNFDESYEVHLAPQAADGGESTKMADDWYSVQVDTATMECVCRFSPNRTGKQRTIRLQHSVAGKYQGIVNNHYIYELRQQ
ncbi:MAG: hypothetical protein IJ710_05880 [Prevotella sp.]|nr:hypothetical protein [Prevotella sp.]